MEVTSKRLTYNSIDLESQKFLDNFPERESCPIDIHSILDIQLGYKIEPLPGLEATFDTVGYASIDEKAIFIDSTVYHHPNKNRFRFTLAHEAGHIHLHRYIFEKVRAKNLNTYKDYFSLRKSIDDDKETYGWLEYQAYSFAGALLIPKRYLINEIDNRIRDLEQKGVDIESPRKQERINFFKNLADYFSVSGVCLRKRLEGLNIKIF